MTVAEPTQEPTRHTPPADNGDAENDAGEEGYLRHTMAAFISAGALAVASLTVAASGLVVLLSPLALIPSFSPQTAVESAQNLSYLGIGIGIVAIALALWSLLRPEAGPLWPRIVAGAAGVVALMVIFQYAVVLLMAANAAPTDSFGS